jgi:hypothetical protein
MYNATEKVFIFAAGIAIGAAAAYMYQKAKVKLEVNSQLEIMREYYEEKYSDKKDIHKEDKKEAKVKKDYSDLTRVYTSYDEQEDISTEVEKKLAENEHPKEEKDPHVIKEEECGYGYDECEVTLYEKDMALVDDASNEEIDAEESLGKENLILVANAPDDEDVYIRNERMGIDYIVHRNSGSFKELMSEYYGENSEKH